jgi:hypothetical protein
MQCLATTVFENAASGHFLTTNGLVDNGAISVSRMQTLLRRRQTNAQAVDRPVPRVPLKSLHPNHVHQVDASVCIQYYLKPGSELKILPIQRFYKNKFANYVKIKRKIIRWTLTDHYSHTIYVKYYQSEGERMEDLFDLLCSAWKGGQHEKLPFRGVPKILMMDAGAANMSKPMQAFLAGLGVKVPAGMPENAARDGSVEKAQDLVERHFESRLKIQPATSIDELNAWALDWMAGFNGTHIHRRYNAPRTACWMGIQHDQLVELPDRDLLENLFAYPEVARTVTPQYAISYKPNSDKYEARLYDVRHIEDIAPGAKVMVILRPHEYPAVGVMYQEREYLVQPIAIGDAGFRADAATIGEEFKAMPETPTQQAIKRGENLAYGEDRAKGQAPFTGMQVYGRDADKVGASYLPRAGVPHQITRQDVCLTREIPVMEALKRLSADIGPVPPELNRAIRATYGASIPEDEAERIIGEIKATGSFTPPPAPAAAQEGAC